MRGAISLRRTAVILAAATMTASALVGGMMAPARAECPSIPPNHDPDVILTVYEVGIERGVSDRVMLAGFEAGWVESHMNNLPCGDKDSLGVFQQRPSYGWGTPAQIMNVEYAATQFFVRAVVEDGNCPSCTAGQIAQRVQRSAFPGRYDQNEAKARSLLAQARAAYNPVAGPAYVFGDEQHVVGVGAGGSLVNVFWSPDTGLVEQDWGGAPLVGRAFGFAHNGQQHVFARGADDTLRHWWQSGTGPVQLDDWSTAGQVTSDPTGFAYRDQQHVFFRNPDGMLEHRYYDVSTGELKSDQWPGGPFVGNPHAFVHKDQQHVFARTADGALIHWYWWPGITPGVDNWGVTSGVASDPTGFSTTTQHHVFYRDTSNHLQHRFWDDPSGTLNGSQWPGGTFTGNPHAYTHGQQQHIFGRRNNGDLVHWYWFPGINASHDTWNAQGVVAGDPFGLSTPGQHHVFYRTHNNTLEHRYHNDTTSTLHTDNWGTNLAP